MSKLTLDEIRSITSDLKEGDLVNIEGYTNSEGIKKDISVIVNNYKWYGEAIAEAYATCGKDKFMNDLVDKVRKAIAASQYKYVPELKPVEIRLQDEIAKKMNSWKNYVEKGSARGEGKYVWQTPVGDCVYLENTHHSYSSDSVLQVQLANKSVKPIQSLILNELRLGLYCARLKLEPGSVDNISVQKTLPNCQPPHSVEFTPRQIELIY